MYNLLGQIVKIQNFYRVGHREGSNFNDVSYLVNNDTKEENSFTSCVFTWGLCKFFK